MIRDNVARRLAAEVVEKWPGATGVDSFLPVEELDPHRSHYAAMHFPRTRLETALVKLARALDGLAVEAVVENNPSTTVAVGRLIDGYGSILASAGCGRRFRQGVLQEWLDWQAARIGWCRSHRNLARVCEAEQAAG